MLRVPASFRNLRASHFSLSSSVSGSNFHNNLTELSECLVGFMNYTKLSAPSYKSLLSDHLKNHRLDEAIVVFNKIPFPGVDTYTKLITGFSRRHRLDDALKLFYEMPERDVVSWNAMIKGCLDCGDLSKAKELFDGMPEKSVVSWTTMMNGHLQVGEVEMAECLFRKMPARDVAAWNSMIHGYFSYGRVGDAKKLFEVMPGKNAISWTSMIAGLDQNGRSEEALVVFGEMVASGVQPTLTTFGSVVTACANLGSLDLGVLVHGQIVKLGYCFDEFLAASLITLYANCKQIENSHKVFKESGHKNVVVWTALLTGCGSNSKHEDASMVFRDMMISGVIPNQSSFTSALNSCFGLEDLHRGKEIHAATVKLGFETDAFVGNSLIVLYAKCGSINDGVAIFKRIGEKNIVSWNSTVIGCAQHGCGKWALALFNQMLRAGVDPDEITFTGLLSACSHSGMLQKARGFFKFLSQTKCIEVKIEHYTCMVDVLGRFGELEEAEEMIRNMPVQETKMAWLTLLGACRMHSNLDVAERAAKSIFDIEPNCSAAYILLSNIYASANRWSDVSRIRERMKSGGTVKQPGSSWFTL
ncbi:pentatricopeptide repeat-containing protein At5g46460, mitochondrial [Rosa rugosa]|uniref:pentatricopeptide repeat-containing protein At5g46460, mitochondrial n=1 Tax=Rosa rugosa TaxID=74645 RepID=UPI002B4088C7|nr:pentatricopeptide repeat-containing protein At5g46460, mitochondrial [Rosa rugosa]